MMTATLLMSIYVTPAAAAKENGNRGKGTPARESADFNGEVRVIGGQAVLVIEVPKSAQHPDGYLHVLLPLGVAVPISVDGLATVLEVKDNAVLLPTAKGTVAVPIEDFCAVMVGGELVLIAEEDGVVLRITHLGNPIPLIVIAAAGLLGIGVTNALTAWIVGECACILCFRMTPDGTRGKILCGAARCRGTHTARAAGMTWLF